MCVWGGEGGRAGLLGDNFGTGKQASILNRVPTVREKSVKNVEGQGKVREFRFESGKFEFFEKVREFHNNNLYYIRCFTVQFRSLMCLNSRVVQTFRQNII